MGHKGFLAHNKACPYSKGSQGGPISSELQEGVPLILMDPRNPALVAKEGTRRDRGHFIYPPLTQILKKYSGQSDRPAGEGGQTGENGQTGNIQAKNVFFVITDR